MTADDAKMLADRCRYYWFCRQKGNIASGNCDKTKGYDPIMLTGDLGWIAEGLDELFEIKSKSVECSTCNKKSLTRKAKG